MSRPLILFLMVVVLIFSTASGLNGYEEGMTAVMDSRVSFKVSDGEVSGVLKTLAQSFDLNIVVGSGITGAVSLTLTDVRLQDALDFILEDTGYIYTLRDNIIVIRTIEKELKTKILRVNYATASEIQSSVQVLLSDQGSLTVSTDGTHLILKERPEYMKEILKEIADLDQPPHQILIEARMVEIEDSDLTAFGITWNSNLSLIGSGEGKGPLGTRTFTPPGAASATTATTSSPSTDFQLNLSETSADITGGQIVYGFTWRRAHITATIDALVRTNRAHILASPTIATLDGKEAKIIIGEKFPFRENTLTAVGTTETTRFVDIGTALRVTPWVINNEDILMEIHPEVSSLNESLSAGPRINTREAQTTVIVKNGQTVVIAGLIQHDKTVIRQKVPLLGNIPILGMAFRNKSTDFVRKELAVFITPYIMRPSKAEEGKPIIDLFSGQRFYNRAMSLMEEFGIESLGKSEAQRYSESAANLKNIIRNYPETELADDALYQLGRLYHEKLKQPGNTAKYWGQLVDEYPDSPYVKKSLLSKIKRAEKKAAKKAQKRLKLKKAD